MQRDLERVLEQAAPIPQTRLDVARVVAGGRRLRRRRRAGMGASAIVLVAAAAFAGPEVVREIRSFDRESARDDVIAPAATPDSPREPFRESKPYDGPAYIDRVRGEQEYINGDKRVVAHGQVNGEPWSLTEYIKDRAHDDGPRLCGELFLGAEGLHGGGEHCAGGSTGDFLVSLSGHYSGSVPEVVPIVGTVASSIASLEVVLEDGRTRPVEIIPSSKDQSYGWYVFFPPPFVAGAVIGYGADGTRVESRSICFPIEPGGSFRRQALSPGSRSVCSE